MTSIVNFLFITCGTVSAEFEIVGSYRNLTVGSTAVIACSLRSLVNSTIMWITQDGSVVNNSGVLTLQSVDYTISGRVFTCRVNAPHLYSPAQKNITISLQGKLNLPSHAQVYFSHNITIVT